MSFVAAAALAYWLLFSALLAMITCDDNCSNQGQADWWGYDAQFFLAAAGCLLGAVALVLGFTSKEGLYRRFLVASLACGLVWVFWVMGSGSF